MIDNLKKKSWASTSTTNVQKIRQHEEEFDKSDSEESLEGEGKKIIDERDK